VFRVAVSGRREQEPSFFTVVVWRDQAEHAAQSLAKGSRVVVVGKLQQRSWTAEDGSAHSLVEVVAEELGPSLRWATTTTTRATRSQNQERARPAMRRAGREACQCSAPSCPCW
jgi:single stranded DNA-binding protein